jgi:hypothetical protein
VYTEDSLQTKFSANIENSQRSAARADAATQKTAFELPGIGFAISMSGINPLSHESPREPTTEIAVRLQAIRILGSVDVSAVSAEFFAGTHTRLSVISKSRFYGNLPSLGDGPRADFVALCLSIYLMQQKPSTETTSMHSSLYVTVKSLVGLIEVTSDLSLDIVHCRLLLALYELGHSLHTAAYMSVATCARSARVLGLNRKPWRNSVGANVPAMEEEKRLWWAIVNMDRFIGLCTGDALFVTDNPESSDPLPMRDQLWLGDSVAADVEATILATPTNITVGQMARECQVAHLTGRVVQHVFDPTSDPTFNAEEAAQLERTLKSFLPLLAEEDLKIGKYCGALGMCHRFVARHDLKGVPIHSKHS